MERLREYLHEQGVVVGEGEFLALVRETFEGIAEKDLWAEPELELPPEELEVLHSGGFSTTREALGSDDPVFRAALDFSALIASALSTKQAAVMLGVDPSRIRQRLTGRPCSLFGVKRHGGWLLPRFQFSGKTEVPGISQIAPHLDPNLNPVAVARWFLSPNPDLVVDEGDGQPVSPRDWLVSGQSPKDVVRLAEGL
jgi:hypothetical protein